MRTKKSASRTTMSFAVALLVAALSAGDARSQVPPQKPQDAIAARVAQAQLAEQAERDFTRAEQLWRALAEDTTVEAEKRGQAWLAVARNLQRLGKAEEAKQALDAAEALGGKAGEEAKRLRDGGADERVMARVKGAIATLVQLVEASSDLGVVDFSKPPAADLLWLGEAAVPGIAAALEEWTDRAWRVSGSVRVLVAIGGDAAASHVARLAASRDPVVRRAVLEGASSGREREPVRSVLMGMCDDSDARVRALALQRLMPVMTTPELLVRATSPDEETRARAIELAWKLENLQNREIVVERRGFSAELIAAVRAAMEERSERVQKAVQGVLEDSTCLRTVAGRELWLDALASDSVNAKVVNNWTRASQHEAAGWLDAAPSTSRLLGVARAIAARKQGGSPEAVTAIGGLTEFVRRCTQVKTTSGTWEVRDDPWPTDHAGVFELARLGCSNALEQWVSRYARLEDLPDWISLMPALGTANLTKSWLARARELPPSEQQRCIDPLVAAMRNASEDNPRPVENGIWALAQLGLPAADAAIVEQVRDRPKHLANAWRSLLQRTDPPPSNDVLADLLVIPGLWPRNVNDDPLVRSLRSQTVQLLAAARDPRLTARMAAAYRAGLPQEQGVGRGALIALFADPVGEDQLGQSRRWAPRYSAEELVRTIVECAATTATEFWSDLYSLLNLMPRGAADDAVAVATCRAIGSILANISKSGMDVREVVGAYVGRSAPGWVEFATAGFDDPRLDDAIARSLPSVPPALVPRVVARAGMLDSEALGTLTYRLARSDDPVAREALVEFLRHESLAVRQSAISAIADAWSDQIVTLIGPLAKDRDGGVHFAVAKALGNSFDRAAIPLLVELLRDPSDGVRKAARESLDQLQYYFDSKLRWERLLSESGIDANNAAEALLKQARAGATIEVRKAAIDSLGTLKVPEALPFLIELMADPDPTLAAAARAAITKINQ